MRARGGTGQRTGEEIWNGDGWAIRLDRASRSIDLVVTDYHAGPLRLSSRELHDLGKVANGRTSGFRRRTTRR
jgi:hypothetical protein